MLSSCLRKIGNVACLTLLLITMITSFINWTDFRLLEVNVLLYAINILRLVIKDKSRVCVLKLLHLMEINRQHFRNCGWLCMVNPQTHSFGFEFPLPVKMIHFYPKQHFFCIHITTFFFYLDVSATSYCCWFKNVTILVKIAP